MRHTGGIFTDPKKERDAHRVRDFIMQHEPQVILVGASGMDSWQVRSSLLFVSLLAGG